MANPIIQSRINGGVPAEVAKFARDTGAVIDRPINDVYITAAAQVSGDRELTLQVRDRAKNPRLGRHLVAVWAATASGGPPSASPTFGAPASGALIQSTASVYVYVTDDDGQVVLDVTASAGTWYFEAIWLGRPAETALAWV